MQRVAWESPSNIAIIKYWGKHGRQLPNNPSVSFTLNQSKTTTEIGFEPRSTNDNVDFTFLFEGQENAGFYQKIEKFLHSLATTHFPYLHEYRLAVSSSNTFPHSSGIASSASSMSALALCLTDIEIQIGAAKFTSETDKLIKASTVARLGSGSACRSVFPLMGLWGYHSDIKGSSDAFAINISDQIHDEFKGFHDDILIISADEKSVSSTAGHNLMIGNPFADVRYNQANDRIITLLSILKHGDIESFGHICEAEAMTLHALMMCSDPSYILMREGTLTAIDRVRKFRLDNKIPLYFTLDAGPNVHLLYPASVSDVVDNFIENQLKDLCHIGRIIKDRVGLGPQKIK
jgi:diphosphomevalonate decarboxylase